jgi:hypothetical protein
MKKLILAIHCNVKEEGTEIYQVESTQIAQNYIDKNYLKLCQKYRINFRAVTNIQHITYPLGGVIIGTYNNTQIILFDYNTKDFSETPALFECVGH